MGLSILIGTRQGICSLIASVLGFIVAVMYRGALRGSATATEYWTGDSKHERWTDMGMLAVGTIFGLPGSYITHSVAYVQNHRDTPGDFVRLFVCGSLSLCTSAMLLAVGDRDAADQGRAIGIIMGVMLLIVGLAQWYHAWWVMQYLRRSSGGSDVGDGYYGRSPHYAVKVAGGQPISSAHGRSTDEAAAASAIPLMSSDPNPSGAPATTVAN